VILGLRRSSTCSFLNREAYSTYSTVQFSTVLPFFLFCPRPIPHSTIDKREEACTGTVRNSTCSPLPLTRSRPTRRYSSSSSSSRKEDKVVSIIIFYIRTIRTSREKVGSGLKLRNRLYSSHIELLDYSPHNLLSIAPILLIGRSHLP
jgi:hypothetical protein